MAEANLEELTKTAVDAALDYEYEGRTIREWVGELKTLKTKPCEDAISRKAMLEYQQYLHGKMSNEENHKLWEFIKGLPSVTPKQKTGEWIPVSERLPEDFQRVLITITNYYGDKVVRVAEYRKLGKRFQVKENTNEWRVGEKGLWAWMPLPRPYKGGKEE